MSLIVETTTVSDSYLMKKMDQGAGITSRILQAIKTGTKLSEKDIEEQILQIHKTRISPIAEHVVSAFERGDIVLVYSDTVRVIQAVPFIVAGTAGSMKAYVFVQSYGNLRGTATSNRYGESLQYWYEGSVCVNGGCVHNPAVLQDSTVILKKPGSNEALCVRIHKHVFAYPE